MAEYIRVATPEDSEVTRLEGYKAMLEQHLERTLEQAERLAGQIAEIETVIADEKASAVEYSEDELFVRGTE